MRRLSFTLIPVLVLGWLAIPRLSALPANDDFTDAEILEGGSGRVRGSNEDATREGGEPAIEGNDSGGSVWWRWVAPAAGPATFHTFGSEFDTILGVYTGEAVNALALVAENDDEGEDLQSLVQFEAAAGTVYHVAVDGFDGESGPIVLSWQSGGIANDDFANAAVLEGPLGAVTGTNVGATREGGEPKIDAKDGGRSLWWRWQAPDTGRITFHTFGSDFDTLLGVYTGEAVDALTLVAENDDEGGDAQSLVEFDVAAGVVYHVAVDGYDGESGDIILSWRFGRIANDDFTDAAPLDEDSGQVSGSNVGATREDGEPAIDDNEGGRSVWWEWAAPDAGRATFHTFGSDFDTLLGAYTGEAVDALALVAENDDEGEDLQSLVEFAVNAGDVYHIAVDGYDGEVGNIVLHWAFEPAGAAAVPFRRGDVVDDGALNLTDGVSTLNFLFQNGGAPSCLKSADADDSGMLNLTDGVYLLNYLFLNGPEPASPLTGCGADPTADGLSCDAHRACSG